MKKFTCIMLTMLIPLIGFAQEAKKEGPKKATINVDRVFAKAGHDAALKAAIAAHAQKFHTGNWKWVVSQILSGPDEGGYLIVEGPNSWTDLEGRGDLGAEHMKDYETNVAPHVEKSSPSMYATYHAELSTVAAGAYSTTKTIITHAFVKPGRNSQVVNSLRTWKKVWEKRGINVGVWSTFASGEPSFLIVYRMKNGWKDLDEDIISTRKAADEVGGPGTYDRLQEEIALDTERSSGEMIEFKPELSSK